MTKLPIYQIDAFADAVFSGNPAAVVPLTSAWLPDATMQKIALENNLSETAFFFGANGNYQLRWFTPGAEVDLCGHATLAAAWVIFNILKDTSDTLQFSTKSGILKVVRDGDRMTMDFPVWPLQEEKINTALAQQLSISPTAQFKATDTMLVLASQKEVKDFKPDYPALLAYGTRCVIITAKGDDGADFISRIFCPLVDVPEDPVTGSSHCMLTPYWAQQYQKNKLSARQISERGGAIACELRGDRVFLSGRGQLYLQGEIFIPA